MKAQDERPNRPEMPPYRLGRHWNTIQAYLIPGIEDDIGELGEEMKKSVETCELLIDDKMFAKYKWCGNGRPPSSRISLLKAYILKAMRNYPYTKTLIAAVREGITDHPAPLRLGVRRRHPGQVPVLADVQGVRKGRRGVKGACRMPGGKPRTQRRHAYTVKAYTEGSAPF